MEQIPIFISISTPPYNKKIEESVNLIYNIIDNYHIDNYRFIRNTLGITSHSHLKGFIHIKNAIKKSFGALVIGFPRDIVTDNKKERNLLYGTILKDQ